MSTEAWATLCYFVVVIFSVGIISASAIYMIAASDVSILSLGTSFLGLMLLIRALLNAIRFQREIP